MLVHILKRSVCIPPNHNYEHLNSSKHDMEAVWIEIIRPYAKNIMVATIYRPPDGNVKFFCEELTQEANSIFDLDKHELFVLGDFNINVNNKESTEYEHLAHFQELTNLKQLITDNTRANSCIDLTFTNSDNILDCGVMDINISDHDLIFVINKKLHSKHMRVQFEGRSYKNYDKDIFVDELTNYDWTDLWESDDPKYFWDFILTAIEEHIDSMCPMKEGKVRQKGELWITNEILELINDKDMAWKQAKKSNNPDDLIIAKALRNQTLCVIRQAKANFVQQKINDDFGSVKKFWEKIYYILQNGKKINQFNLIDEDSDTVIPEESTADYNAQTEFFQPRFHWMLKAETDWLQLRTVTYYLLIWLNSAGTDWFQWTFHWKINAQTEFFQPTFHWMLNVGTDCFQPKMPIFHWQTTRDVTQITTFTRQSV